MPTQQPPKACTPEVGAVLERAVAGDPTVGPELQQALDDHPEVAALFGDMVGHAARALQELVCKDNPLVRASLTRQLADLRQRLAATAPSPLERLLIDRIALTWVEVYYGDIDLAHHLLGHGGDAPATKAAQQRLDAAHA